MDPDQQDTVPGRYEFNKIDTDPAHLLIRIRIQRKDMDPADPITQHCGGPIKSFWTKRVENLVAVLFSNAED